MDIVTIIGTVGASIILLGFILNQFGKLTTEDFWYDFLNLLGGVILMYYAYLLESIPFFILNLVWTAVSLKDVVSHVRK